MLYFNLLKVEVLETAVLETFSSPFSTPSHTPIPLLPPPSPPHPLTHHRAIAHSLLEKVDRYLWSPRPNSLHPQLLNIHTREKQRDQAEERLQAPVFPSLVEFSSTLEDASSHWGVRSKQGAVCGRCQLSLLRSVSDLQPGIVAFCCGEPITD